MRLTVLGTSGGYPPPGSACSGYLVEEDDTRRSGSTPGSGTLPAPARALRAERADGDPHQPPARRPLDRPRPGAPFAAVRLRDRAADPCLRAGRLGRCDGRRRRLGGRERAGLRGPRSPEGGDDQRRAAEDLRDPRGAHPGSRHVRLSHRQRRLLYGVLRRLRAVRGAPGARARRRPVRLRGGLARRAGDEDAPERAPGRRGSGAGGRAAAAPHPSPAGNRSGGHARARALRVR